MEVRTVAFSSITPQDWPTAIRCENTADSPRGARSRTDHGEFYPDGPGANDQNGIDTTPEPHDGSVNEQTAADATLIRPQRTRK